MGYELHHAFVRCKWCGRHVSGCPTFCQFPVHVTRETESCAICAHLSPEERRMIEQLPDDPEATQSLLSLVMENPPTLETVAGWTHGQRVAAEEWAASEHLRASDNYDVPKVLRPAFVKEAA